MKKKEAILTPIEIMKNKELKMKSTISLKSFISDENDDNNEYDSIDTNELLSEDDSAVKFIAHNI